MLNSILSKLARKRIDNLSHVTTLFANKSGIEIGGPSRIFGDKGFIPLYRIIKELDGCNFADRTIWEGNLEKGKTYHYYSDKSGIQYISDATDLSPVPDSKYAFLLSSNCLEHIANPLKAIAEWYRVLENGGVMLLVLPNKKYCFDHNRSVTPFSHLLLDYQNDVKEDDLTHLDEILKMHDLEMDKPAGNLEQFRERSLKNFENRALHQHVFDLHVLKEIFSYFKIDILQMYEGRDFVIIGKKKED